MSFTLRAKLLEAEGKSKGMFYEKLVKLVLKILLKRLGLERTGPTQGH